MNERKLKSAFSKIKEDMNYLLSEISSLKKVNSLNSDIKKEIEEIKKFNLEKFVTEMKSEFKLINTLTQDFNKKYEQNSNDIKEFNNQLEKYNNRVEEVRKKILEEHNETENAHIDLELLENKFSEFQQIINEKISLEIAGLKLEVTDDLARLSQEVKSINTTQNTAINIENSLTELNEMINEKIDLEIGGLKMQFTEELGKTYEWFNKELSKSNKKFEKEEEKSKEKTNKLSKSKLVSKKSKSKKSKEKEEKTSKKLQMPVEEKKEGKFKKVAKWLFVDDEEDEIDSIKTEVKKGK